VEQPSSWSATADISFQRFKQLIKTFLFGCWHHSALWLTVKAAPHKFSHLHTVLKRHKFTNCYRQTELWKTVTYSGDSAELELRFGRRIIVAWPRCLMWMIDGGSRQGSPSTWTGIVLDVSRQAERHWVSRTPPWAPICNPAWITTSTITSYFHVPSSLITNSFSIKMIICLISISPTEFMFRLEKH